MIDFGSNINDTETSKWITKSSKTSRLLDHRFLKKWTVELTYIVCLSTIFQHLEWLPYSHPGKTAIHTSTSEIDCPFDVNDQPFVFRALLSSTLHGILSLKENNHSKMSFFKSKAWHPLSLSLSLLVY